MPWEDKWTILQPLGGGGQGDTFEVKSNDDKVRAVLKRLKIGKDGDQKARRRMFQEVGNLRVLANAGAKVPEILDCNTDKFDDVAVPLYFVMKYIDGTTLSNVIQKSNGLTVEESIAIALELCSTMQAAIKDGIVHRDIKPENIIVRSLTPPDVVMVDFGLSFNEDDSQNLTEVGETLDNKFLSLPERRGPDENKRDLRSDLTGICAILHYCLTKCIPRNLRDSQGRPPHMWPNYTLSGKVLDEKRQKELNRLLNRGFNYEIDLRFQSIDELITRLQGVLKPTSVSNNEDLETVLLRESANIKRKNRVIQLNEFYKNTQIVAQSLLARFNDISQRLGRHPSLFYLSNESGPYMYFEKLTGKDELGDLVARTRFGCGVQNHQILCKIHYLVTAVGQECSVYRELHSGIINGTFLEVDPPTLIMRYDGETPLETNERAEWVADMDKAVARAITIMSERLQSEI